MLVFFGQDSRLRFTEPANLNIRKTLVILHKFPQISSGLEAHYVVNPGICKKTEVDDKNPLTYSENGISGAHIAICNRIISRTLLFCFGAVMRLEIRNFGAFQGLRVTP